jgi:hypothetical protein
MRWIIQIPTSSPELWRAWDALTEIMGRAGWQPDEVLQYLMASTRDAAGSGGIRPRRGRPGHPVESNPEKTELESD